MAVPKNPFNCPQCTAYAQHNFQPLFFDAFRDGVRVKKESRITKSICVACGKISYWFTHEGTLLYPSKSTAPNPSTDMPPEIEKVYQEARAIFAKSPRGAAAMLRLIVQIVCLELEPKKKTIDSAIKELVKKGLPVQVQKALDSVRVIGSYAVHPGTIDLNEKPGTAEKLFGIVNFIVEKMITEPKEIEDFYEKEVPEEKKQAIKNRDKK